MVVATLAVAMLLTSSLSPQCTTITHRQCMVVGPHGSETLAVAMLLFVGTVPLATIHLL
jgi:hypothetical protein